jgi:hypothetical protein
MSELLNWRLWVAVLGFSALTFTHFLSYRSGRAAVSADWSADKLATSEAARQREKALSIANQGVDRAYQIDKKRRAAAERVTAGRLRDLQAALADNPDNPNDTAPASGTDDPRDAIIYQCTGALVGLDVYAQQLAGTTAALQDYASSVCVRSQ